jgi:hypothetical protein
MATAALNLMMTQQVRSFDNDALLLTKAQLTRLESLDFAQLGNSPVAPLTGI